MRLPVLLLFVTAPAVLAAQRAAIPADPPFTALAAFQAGRIVSQQLVDSSVILLGARRLHVTLGAP
jgi:hypothetical protein